MIDLSNKSLEELISLKEKVVVVTGAASGIGYATAKRMAQGGATVILADINKEALPRIEKELSVFGKVVPMHMDITSLQSIQDVIKKIDEDYHRLDAWLNIAGIYPGAGTLDITAEQWKQMMDVNFEGTFHGAQQAINAMLAYGKPGVIVNTISTTMERPVAGLLHYTASKGGVKFITRALAKEFGPKGIRVLAVSPTMTMTEGLRAQEVGLTMAFGENPFEAYAKPLPFGRLAEPDDIARVMFFAVSDLSAIMSGSVLFADAGETTV